MPSPFLSGKEEWDGGRPSEGELCEGVQGVLGEGVQGLLSGGGI